LGNRTFTIVDDDFNAAKATFRIGGDPVIINFG